MKKYIFKILALLALSSHCFANPTEDLVRAIQDNNSTSVARVHELLDRFATELDFKAILPNTENHDTLYTLAARMGNIGVIQAFLSKGIGNGDLCIKAFGATPLYIASQEGHLNVVEALLRAGALPNKARTSDGNTPLYIASHGGHLNVVEALLRAGALPNSAPNNGVTPLLIAAHQGHLKIIDILIREGADLITDSILWDNVLSIVLRNSDKSKDEKILVVRHLLRKSALFRQITFDTAKRTAIGTGNHEAYAFIFQAEIQAKSKAISTSTRFPHEIIELIEEYRSF